MGDENAPHDPDASYEWPPEHQASGRAELGGESEETVEESGFSDAGRPLREKTASAEDQIKENPSDISEQTREKLQALRVRALEISSLVRSRASKIGGRVQDRAREACSRARERFTRTADKHPLELGLGCLAVGVLAGLALPTPAPVSRIAGPAVDRLRERTRETGREMIDKGRRVVHAAITAAKTEARIQGLAAKSASESAVAAASGETPEQASPSAPTGVTAGPHSPV